MWVACWIRPWSIDFHVTVQNSQGFTLARFPKLEKFGFNLALRLHLITNPLSSSLSDVLLCEHFRLWFGIRNTLALVYGLWIVFRYGLNLLSLFPNGWERFKHGFRLRATNSRSSKAHLPVKGYRSSSCDWALKNDAFFNADICTASQFWIWTLIYTFEFKYLWFCQ